MSAQPETGFNPEEAGGAKPELSVVSDLATEEMFSRFDGLPMKPIMAGDKATIDTQMEWYQKALKGVDTSREMAAVIEDAFAQGLLRHEEIPTTNGETKTRVVGLEPEVVKWFGDARVRQEELRTSERTAKNDRAAKARQSVDKQHQKDKDEPKAEKGKAVTQTEDEKSVAKADKDAKRVAKEQKAAEKQAARAEKTSQGESDTTNTPQPIPEPFGRERWRDIEPLTDIDDLDDGWNDRSNSSSRHDRRYTPPPPVHRGRNGAEPDSPEEFNTRVESKGQAEFAAYAAQDKMEARYELQQRDVERQKAAERLGDVLGLKLSEEDPRIDELEEAADKLSNVSIAEYAKLLTKTVEKAIDPAGGIVRETLRGDQLTTIEDLRTALGVSSEQLFGDKDKRSFTLFFESDLTGSGNNTEVAEKILLVERYDRQTGRLVEASVVRGEDLLKTNRSGEVSATKNLKQKLALAQTETSYATPGENASFGEEDDKSSDIGMAAAIMRRREASGEQVDSMRQTKKIKRRQPWWTGLFSGPGN